MKHSVQELFDIVHSHYPRGMMSDDPNYKESSEYCRLVAARRKAGADQRPWRAFLQRLDEQFPANNVQNLSFHLPMGALDAAYSGQIYLPTLAGENHHTVGFLVSFLVPYYVVYSSRAVEDVEEMEALRAKPVTHVTVFADDTCYVVPASIVKPEIVAQQKTAQVFRHELRFEFSPDEEPYGAWIARDIEATWGYKRLPPEVGNIIVPDVATNLRCIGEATLYDCLMSDTGRGS